MTKNTKQTSTTVASHAASILKDPNSSQIKKSLAASALAQRDGSKQTGADMETKASKVLSSDKYAQETKELAASVLSQSNKER